VHALDHVPEQQLNLSDTEIEVGVELVDHALVVDYLV
jgi:hypothetical protein